MYDDVTSSWHTHSQKSHETSLLWGCIHTRVCVCLEDTSSKDTSSKDTSSKDTRDITIMGLHSRTCLCVCVEDKQADKQR